jgi:acetyltransferase
MVMVINVTPVIGNPIDIIEAIGDVARDRPKPVMAVMMATEEFYDAVRPRLDLPPVYHFPESAARAMFQLARYAAWRHRPADAPIPDFPADDAAVEAFLDAAPVGGYLDPGDAVRVLELYGIPVARWRMARDREEALAAARQIGYPVVVKAVAPDLVHKSEAGAVRVDLRGDGELAEAVDAMERSVAAAGHRVEGFLVQEMARGGHEVIFGITTDARFGPILMFGLGGKYVEVFQDVRFGLLPLAPYEALEMIRGIRGFKLLQGVRGEAGADLDVLCEVLMRLAQLVQRHPRVRELDINPFLAAPDRGRAKALDARIRVAGPEEVTVQG